MIITVIIAFNHAIIDKITGMLEGGQIFYIIFSGKFKFNRI